MGATVRMWRWRRNPLRRRSDVIEAWAGLAALLVAAVGAPLVGAVSAGLAEDSLVRQGQDRRLASALLAEDAPATETLMDGSTSPEGVHGRVRWTAADGSVRTGSAPVEAGAKAGSRSVIWLDAHGRIAPRPPSAGEAEAQGVVVGATAAGGFCLLVVGCRGLMRAGLDRRRAADWEREWAETGPGWSRSGA